MSHGLESGLSGAALPLESGPGTPGLTQAQEGGGPGRHGPALSRDVLESVLRDRACSPWEKGMCRRAFLGHHSSSLTQRGRAPSPPAHFPLRGSAPWLFLPLGSHEVQLLSNAP